MSHDHRLIEFYETHPINEQQILKTLENNNITLATLSQEILQNYDQDHFGGIKATERLARDAAIGASHAVLDVCSGMGGPARYLAHHYGCRVMGLDVTESRCLGARRLTELVKLDHLVEFTLGDAARMPFDERRFDAVIGQEAWAHVADKDALIGECSRVLKAKATIAFTDILKTAALSTADEQRLQKEMVFNNLSTFDGYRQRLAEAGFGDCAEHDLSAHWAQILVDRLAMYRGLRDQTVARFGHEHYRRWDDTYAFFVGLYQSGALAGGYFIARRYS